MANKNLTPRDRIKHEASRVARKWSTGSRRNLKVDKLQDKLLKESTTLFLENIDVELDKMGSTSLIEESASSIGSWSEAGSLGSGQALNGATGNSAMYKPLSLALARRVFPSLFAHKLVGVQPMAAPVGIAFAMRNKYVNPKYDGNNEQFLGDAAWDDIPQYAGFSGGYVEGATNKFDASAAISGTITGVNGADTDVTALPVVYEPVVGEATDGTAPTANNPVTEIIDLANGGTLYKIYFENVEEMNIYAALRSEAKLYETIGQGGIQAEYGQGGESVARGLATNNAEFLGIRNGDQVSNGGSDILAGSTGNMNEVGIEFSKKLIEAVGRKLGASFSLESMQDIKALHEIDLKMEVIEVLQYETTAELDRELLSAMKTTSINTDPNIGGGDVLVVDIAAAIGTNPDNRQLTAVVINAIMLAANTVAKKTRRGRANFVIVAPSVASIIQSATPYFTANVAKVDPGIVLSGAESTEIGKINNQITVYLDQFATTDYALVGYKGQNRVSDSGIIFSPYTMNVIQEAVAQENFQPRVGVMSRYAITTNLLDAGRYYRSIYFKDLAHAYSTTNLGTARGW